MKKNIFTSSHDTGDHWASISDMMSGLMIIFLFIAVAYMSSVQEEKAKIENIAVDWRDMQDELYRDLYEEFKDDLDKWQASIDRETLAFRFNEPSVFFDPNEASLKPRFKQILNDFFPRYIAILRGPTYRDEIEEVRIEGHASSEYGTTMNTLEAYFANMRLSQDRTRNVLEYCLSEIPAMTRHQRWAIATITANGLSSSRLILNEDGTENKELSRRVEFRVLTKASDQMKKILEGIR